MSKPIDLDAVFLIFVCAERDYETPCFLREGDLKSLQSEYILFIY